MNRRSFGLVDIATAATLAFATATTALVFPRLPGRVPIHFDASGTPNGYAPRAVGAWLLPAVSVGLALFLRVAPRLLPHEWSRRLAKSRRALDVATLFFVLALTAIQAIVLRAANDTPQNAVALIPVVLGALWICLGQVLPRVRRNPFFGVRTFWTVSSDENWARTHRLAGYTFTLGGLAAMVVAFSRAAASATVMLIGAALVPALYSYYLARHLPPESHK